jgi:hypothetical protein
MNSGQTSFLPNILPQVCRSTDNSRCLILRERNNPKYLATLEVGPFLPIDGTSYFCDEFFASVMGLKAVLGPPENIGDPDDKVQYQWSMRYTEHESLELIEPVSGERALMFSEKEMLEDVKRKCRNVYGDAGIGHHIDVNYIASSFQSCVSLYDWKVYDEICEETDYINWHLGAHSEVHKEKIDQICMVLSSLSGTSTCPRNHKDIYIDEKYSFQAERDPRRERIHTNRYKLVR